MGSKQTREALAQAVKDSGMHPSEVVIGITTERALRRWIDEPKVRPNPFAARQVAKRLGRPYMELFE